MPRLRALLITLALVVYGIAAAPIPPSVKKHEVFSESGRDELRRWVEVLHGVGVETSVKELGGQVLAVGQPLTKARQKLLSPFSPLLRLTGTGQRWGLFAYPDTRPQALVVECEVGDRWRTLFRAGDPEHDWASSRLRHRRIRGVWDGVARRKKPGRAYEALVDRIAAWVEAEEPDCGDEHVRE